MNQVSIEKTKFTFYLFILFYPRLGCLSCTWKYTF